jgi:hypothetical protein
VIGVTAKKTKNDVLAEKKAAELAMLEGLHTPKGPIADATIQYVAVCVTPCTFRGQYWPEGREYRGFIEPPEHFKVLERFDISPKPPVIE